MPVFNPLPDSRANQSGLSTAAPARESQAVDARVGRGVRSMRSKGGVDFDTLSAGTGISVTRLRAIEAGAVRAEASELYDIAECLRSSISDIFLHVRERTGGT